MTSRYFATATALECAPPRPHARLGASAIPLCYAVMVRVGRALTLRPTERSETITAL